MAKVSIQPGTNKQRVSLRQKLYQQIKHEIITGELKPAQQLSESELSVRYEVSGTPVREALTSLQRDQLVEYQPNRGFMVAPISIRDVQEIYEARVVFESALLRLAMQRITEADLQELQKTQEVSYDLNDPASVDRYFQANYTFHMTIAEASRNSRLVVHYQSLLDEAQRLIYMDMKNTNVLPIWHKSHQLLIDALRNKDEAGGIRTLEEIMENGKRRVLGGYE
jgi:DNA-binding GntR family transcriptional regulator